MANVLFAGLKGGRQIGSAGTASGATSVTAAANGSVQVDEADTDLVAAVQEQGGVQVDTGNGTEEAVTGGTVQTAITLSGCYIHAAGSGATINIRNENASGDLLAGPFVLGANESRVIVFPVALDAPDGVFFHEAAGGLDTAGGGDGFLIP